MMRRLLLALLALPLLLCAQTKKADQDFASRFMSLYAERYQLQCRTVSPTMVERVLHLQSVENDTQLKQLLAQVKTMRILGTSNTTQSGELIRLVATLGEANQRRYTSETLADGTLVLLRRRRKSIVEIVVAFADKSRPFQLINVTGTMDADFLDQILSR